MEKGDLFVLLSLIVLALIISLPFYLGGNLSSREQGSIDALLAIRTEATKSGLVDTLQTLGEEISSLRGLRPRRDAPELMPGSDAPVLWRDGMYLYGLRFRGFLGDGPALVAVPEKPGETGSKRFLWAPGASLEDERIRGMEAKGVPAIMATAEEKAKTQVNRIIRILEGTEGQARRVGGLCALLRRNLPKTLKPLPDPEFGCLSPMWTDGNYLFRVSMAMTHDGLDLDLWAWPKVRGSTGFDAFFASGRSIPAQSWNMSNPYDGSASMGSIPRPGYARDRSGKALGEQDNWVGWDGKRWFALEPGESGESEK